MKNSLFLGTALGALLVTGAAQATVTKYVAQMDGASEVPATDSTAHAKGSFVFDTDTKKLCGQIDYTATGGGADALSSALTGAHIHQAATEGGTGGVIIPFATGATPLKIGPTVLTDAQVTALTTGLLYTNLHTTNHAESGEIRGDIVEDTGNDGEDVAACLTATTPDGGTTDGGTGSTTPPGTTPPGTTPPGSAGDAGATTPVSSTSDDGCSTTGSAPTSGLAIALGVGVALAAIKRKKKQQ